jgi:hypothetical protein
VPVERQKGLDIVVTNRRTRKIINIIVGAGLIGTVLFILYLTYGCIDAGMFETIKKKATLKYVLNSITLFVLFSSLLLLNMQLSSNEKLKEAEFITNFNTNFIQVDHTLGVFSHEKAKYCNYEEKSSYYAKVLIYLAYFEPLYFLLEDGIIEKDRILSIIRLRFSIVASNCVIQEAVIEKNQDALENVIKLYKKLGANELLKAVEEVESKWFRDLNKYLDEKNKTKRLSKCKLSFIEIWWKRITKIYSRM